MKKLIFILVGLFIVPLWIHAQTIYIHLKDGSVITLNLANIDSITFDIPEPVTAPDTLLAYYPLDGDAMDASGNGYHGKVVNAVPDSDRFGNPNGCFYFDGNSYIDLGNVFNDLYTPLSVSFWFYKETFHNIREGIFVSDNFTDTSNYYGFWIRTAVDTQIVVGYGDGGHPSPENRQQKLSEGKFKIGEWNHVVVVIRGPMDMNIYINGEEAGGRYNGSGGPMVHNEFPAIIGKMDFENMTFTGKIDDLRIYKGVLSHADVLKLYHEGGWGF
ncbi:MAG: LamG domain-containing protein [Calditrichaeota bacterium]|nr:LamG domain-containing protein [Calditrichota bacterium]